jgi:hydrogenase-4 component B
MESWRPAWTVATAPPSLAVMGQCHIALAILATMVGIWFWRRIKRSVPKRALTWDCGYGMPTARMQYTAGSFAGIITGWFAWILRPVMHKNLPSTTLPVSASFEQHTPETVLEYGVEPVGGLVMRMVQEVRRLQHGRVQAYLFYLLVGLAVLAIIVVASEK